MRVKFGGPHSSHSQEIQHEAVRGRHFLLFFHDNFQPEVVSDVISDVEVGQVGTDVLGKFCDSRSNRSQDI